MKPASTEKVLDDVDIKILELVAKGKTYKEITAYLYLNKDNVAYRVRKMKQELKCDSLPQLITTYNNM
jgi:DNA-binding NarL/FixJ family response regulator